MRNICLSLWLYHQSPYGTGGEIGYSHGVHFGYTTLPSSGTSQGLLPKGNALSATPAYCGEYRTRTDNPRIF